MIAAVSGALGQLLCPRQKLFALLIVSVTLAGCSSKPVSTVASARNHPADAARAHTESIAALESWQAEGRLAFQTGDQGGSASFSWTQDHEHYRIVVRAPLAQGSFELLGSPDAVILVTADNQRFSATSAESLMQRHMGWQLPVSGAQFWLRGIPVNVAAAAQANVDEYGRWRDFAEHGWRVSVLDYHADATPSLPRKLFLSRDQLSVRLLVKQWQTHL